VCVGGGGLILIRLIRSSTVAGLFTGGSHDSRSEL
jgi:hypothetical protein